LEGVVESVRVEVGVGVPLREGERELVGEGVGGRVRVGDAPWDRLAVGEGLAEGEGSTTPCTNRGTG
jgi:hypothetical protein